MNENDEITDAWNKLRESWDGEDAKGFFDAYVRELIDISSAYENYCYSAKKKIAGFLEELNDLERNMMNE